jgi:phage-related protein
MADVEISVGVVTTGAEQLQQINKDFDNLMKTSMSSSTGLSKQSESAEKSAQSLKQLIPQGAALAPILNSIGLGGLFAAAGVVEVSVAFLQLARQMPALQASFSNLGMTIAQYGGPLLNFGQSLSLTWHLSNQLNQSFSNTQGALESLMEGTRNLGISENYLAEAEQMHLATGNSLGDMSKMLAQYLSGENFIINQQGQLLWGVAAAQYAYTVAMQQSTTAGIFYNKMMDEGSAYGQDLLDVLKLLGAFLLVLTFGPIITSLQNFERVWSDAGKYTWGDLGNGIKTAIKDVVNWLSDDAWPLMSDAWHRICSGFKTDWDALVDVKGWVTTAITDASSYLSSTATTLLHGIWSDICTDAKNVWNALLDAKTWVTDAIDDAVHWISGTATTLLHDVWTDLCNDAKNVWNSIIDIKTWVSNAFNNAITWLENEGKTLWNDTLGKLFGTIGSAPSSTPGYANGTDYAPGGFGMVGETGPEPMYIPQGSVIGAGASGMGGGMNITFNISSSGEFSQSAIQQIIQGIESVGRNQGLF